MKKELRHERSAPYGTQATVTPAPAPDAAMLIRRETIASVLINAVLSIVFFCLVFGFGGPAPFARLGPDFLPQAFMIALMGSAIPALLTARRVEGTDRRRILLRALAVALAAMIVAGGGAWLLCTLLPYTAIGYATALPVKVAFGAALAAVITPPAVRDVLSRRGLPVRPVPWTTREPPLS